MIVRGPGARLGATLSEHGIGEVARGGEARLLNRRGNRSRNPGWSVNRPHHPHPPDALDPPRHPPEPDHQFGWIANAVSRHVAHVSDDRAERGQHRRRQRCRRRLDGARAAASHHLDDEPVHRSPRQSSISYRLASLLNAIETWPFYLKLFDAGDGFDGRDMGAILEFDELDPQRGLGVPNHDLVRDVLDSLKRHQAVFGSDGSRPLFYSLDGTLRNRMADRQAHSRAPRGKPERISIADRLREELAWVDNGEVEVPQGTFTKIEALIRTGWDNRTYSDAAPLMARPRAGRGRGRVGVRGEERR